MKWVVSKEESGQKLVAFLTQKLEGSYSARALKRVIESNGCLINGRTERFASTVVGNGDNVILEIREAHPKQQKIEPARILFEDESLLVYDKPAGINCDEKGILALLKTHCRSLRLVHRLDRDTTGVLLCGKSQEIFEQLVEQFRQLKVNKSYKTIVDGVIKKPHGTIDNYLGKKHLFAGQTLWGEVAGPPGLHAITEWECLKTGNGASLLACYPKTGRTHQIRVHMAGMEHPILGDHQYGKIFQCSYRPERYLLHAEAIEFIHPQTVKKIKMEASLPADFISAQKKLFSE